MGDENIWVGEVPKDCSICEEAIGETFVDGKLDGPSSPWTIMCPDCHKFHGVGLGFGKGQLYQKQGDEYRKIAG